MNAYQVFVPVHIFCPCAGTVANDDPVQSRRITHGVTVSPDNRFAFVTVEGVADDPGTVDVIDLRIV